MSPKKTFESALKRLEEIISDLESGDIALDDMLKNYEEGAELLKFCFSKLEKAEQVVKKLAPGDDDEFKLEPM